MPLLLDNLRLLHRMHQHAIVDMPLLVAWISEVVSARFNMFQLILMSFNRRFLAQTMNLMIQLTLLSEFISWSPLSSILHCFVFEDVAITEEASQQPVSKVGRLSKQSQTEVTA